MTDASFFISCTVSVWDTVVEFWEAFRCVWWCYGVQSLGLILEAGAASSLAVAWNWSDHFICLYFSSVTRKAMWFCVFRGRHGAFLCHANKLFESPAVTYI
mmetsp:Transcript_25261/g.66300  ORF Transcript_25261/g.66300 Transcript_25261/m.66300 type:complete len:101 (-) Transcript_25261:205-507(-)